MVPTMPERWGGVILPLGAVGLAALDQATKWLARRAFGPLDVIILIQGFLHLTRTENTGSVFGILKRQQLPLIILSVVVIAVILYLFLSEKIPEDRLARICAMLLLAGALGNLADRVMRGAVFDFIDFLVWPVFNLADAMISAGVAGLIFRELRASMKRD